MNRKPILMIDDNMELLELAGKLFDAREFFFVTARDGAEALFKIKNQSFSVIVCDVKMPRMDGITFLKEFRRLPKGDTPVLFYSGHLDELPANVQELKNVYRMNKPGQGYELIEKVRSLAASHASAAPHAAKTVAPNPSKLAKLYGLNGSERKFEPDSFLFHEGEKGADVFVIMEGEVEILKENPDGSLLPLETLHKGDVIGSLVPEDGHYRTFAARTKTLVTLASYSQLEVLAELNKTPDWVQAMVRSQHARLVSAYQALRSKAKPSR